MDISRTQLAVGGGALATAGVATTGIALAKGLHMVTTAPLATHTSDVQKIGDAVVSSWSSSSEVTRSLHLRGSAKPFVFAGVAAAALGVGALVAGLQK